ncbi:hypothetical protein T484DRAFT_1903565, partial [Baffinella frigidus]
MVLSGEEKSVVVLSGREKSEPRPGSASAALSKNDQPEQSLERRGEKSALRGGEHPNAEESSRIPRRMLRRDSACSDAEAGSDFEPGMFLSGGEHSALRGEHSEARSASPANNSNNSNNSDRARSDAGSGFEAGMVLSGEEKSALRGGEQSEARGGSPEGGAGFEAGMVLSGGEQSEVEHSDFRGASEAGHRGAEQSDVERGDPRPGSGAGRSEWRGGRERRESCGRREHSDPRPGSASELSEVEKSEEGHRESRGGREHSEAEHSAAEHSEARSARGPRPGSASPPHSNKSARSPPLRARSAGGAVAGGCKSVVKKEPKSPKEPKLTEEPKLTKEFVVKDETGVGMS